MQGATIIEGVAGHRRPARSAARSPACAPPYGDIEAEYVVNCAGMWARQLGAKVGREHPAPGGRALLPASPSRSPGSPSDWPVLEDPASLRLLPRGGRRPDGRPVRAGVRAVERRRHPRRLLVRRDPARLGPHGPVRREGDGAACPISIEVGVTKFFCGPESFTPDLQPVVGEAPELKNYFVAAGLNSIGILTGGGLGRVLAHWIINGRPDVDVTGINIDRLHTYQANPEYRAHAHGRVARHGLPVPLPDALDADRARREDVAVPRPARRARRVLPRRQRLGGRRLVRARRASSRTSSSCRGAGRTGSRTGRPSTAPRARA